MKQHLSFLAVVTAVFLAVRFAIAAAVSTGQESLSEHSSALLDFAAYAIVVLASGLVALVLWNIKDLKQSHRESNTHLEGIIVEIKKRADHTEDLLLETRKTLLELHAEHGVMMDRCSKKSKRNE